MSGAELIDASTSAAPLPAGLTRQLRAPARGRPADFLAAFDADTAFYDCFRHVDGTRVLLAGPPPIGIETAFRNARFTALPSRSALAARFHTSLSVMLTELVVPEASTSIEVRFDTGKVELPIRPNLSPVLAGRRLLFSMNRNNDLAWIREWAAFHARTHGTDAVVLFDNGSTRYSAGDIAETLRGVAGLAQVAVPVWPQKFGRTDPAVRPDPYWAHFAQIASMSVVLRRYGALGAGLLNCDIDELCRPLPGGSIYDAAARARQGLVVFRGQWIEAMAGEPAMGDHRDFVMRLADPKRARSRPNKWALDPRRRWVQRLGVHPYWHWIAGRPPFSKTRPAGAGYWHFRGINTNWKGPRTAQRGDGTRFEIDPALAALFAGGA